MHHSKHMFKVNNSKNHFEFISLYLVKIAFITLESNNCFRTAMAIIEDNTNIKIYGKHLDSSNVNL